MPELHDNHPSKEDADYYRRVFANADESGKGFINGVSYDLNVLPVEAVRQMRRMANGLEQFSE